jgi:hypothetical protein
MRKSLVVLGILATMSAPSFAQVAPVGSQVQPAKPLMVKKRVCTYAEEDSYSRLGGRKICRTIEVKADDQTKQPQGQQVQQPAQPQQTPPNSGR